MPTPRMTGNQLTDLLATIKNRTTPAADHPAPPKETLMPPSPTPAGPPPTDPPADDHIALLFEQAEAWAQRAREFERNMKIAHGRATYFLQLAHKEQAEAAGGQLIAGDQDLPVMQAAAAQHNGRTSAAAAATAGGPGAEQPAAGPASEEAPTSTPRPDAHRVNGAEWAQTGT